MLALAKLRTRRASYTRAAIRSHFCIIHGNISRGYTCDHRVGPERACVTRWMLAHNRSQVCDSEEDRLLLLLCFCHRSGPSQMHKIVFFLSLPRLLHRPVTTHTCRPTCARVQDHPVNKSMPTYCSHHSRNSSSVLHNPEMTSRCHSSTVSRQNMQAESTFSLSDCIFLPGRVGVGTKTKWEGSTGPTAIQ